MEIEKKKLIELMKMADNMHMLKFKYNNKFITFDQGNKILKGMK